MANFVKQDMIKEVDGGHHENCRYWKTVMCSINYFIVYNVDVLFEATNAAGRSVQCWECVQPG